MIKMIIIIMMEDLDSSSHLKKMDCYTRKRERVRERERKTATGNSQITISGAYLEIIGGGVGGVD